MEGGGNLLKERIELMEEIAVETMLSILYSFAIYNICIL